MDNDDWDIFSIVRSCNATSFTTPTTTFETPLPTEIQTTTTITSNNIISYQNTTPSCFDDLTFTHENRSVHFAPLKPTDFIELDKLMIKFNPTTTTTTTIPTPTTTSIPTIITTATSYPTTTITTIPTPSTDTISSHITNINTSVHASNQNSTFFDFPELIDQQHMQSNESIELENLILNFNPTPTPTITTPNITAPTTTTPTSISPITTTTTSTTPTTTIVTSKTTTHIIPTITTTMTNTRNYNFPMLIEQQQIQTNNKNQVFIHEPVACIEITTAHFDLAYNNPSIPKQPSRKSNRPQIILPQNSSRVLPNTQPQQSNCETRKRKNNNQVVCYVTEDKLSEDSWAWRKYGQKPIKGSPHPRSYYKCSTFTDCFARKQVEKCKTKENTYIVTYRGEHNHNKPELNKNYAVGTSKSKPSETILPAVREAESSPNIKNLGLPNVAMLRFDQPESSNSQVLVDQSKIPYPEKELIETQSHAAVEVGSSLNVGNLGSHNIMMLQFDESKSSNAQVFPSESKFPYSETRFIGSSNDEENILIPNITAMSEDFLLNFNHLNKGVLFP